MCMYELHASIYLQPNWEKNQLDFNCELILCHVFTYVFQSLCQMSSWVQNTKKSIFMEKKKTNHIYT